MVQVKPFRGIFYNPAKISSFDQVVAPPYDVISPEQAKTYQKLHPLNVIRLILGKNDPDKNPRIYRKAAGFWKKWLGSQVLIKDRRPAVYFLEQHFKISGRPVRRRGMIALAGVEDFSSKTILPHEGTLIGPKKDRLRLLTACRANFDPLFFLYPDGRSGLRKVFAPVWRKKPLIKVKDRQGIIHKLWRENDQKILKKISRALGRKKMIIADGHHRYETALNYKKTAVQKYAGSKLAAGAGYVLSYLIDLEESGLKILPIHRLVRPVPAWPAAKLLDKLKEHFIVKPVVLPAKTGKTDLLWYCLEKKLAQFGRRRSAFLLDHGSKFYLVRLKDNKILSDYLEKACLAPTDTLDVNVLQNLVIDRLFGIEPASAGEKTMTYANDGITALAKVKQGLYPMAFLLNPVKIEQVRKITAAGLRLPQKSTFFYPKILSGLVMRSLEE